MGEIASQITSLAIVYSICYSDANQRKHQSSALLPLCGEVTGDRSWVQIIVCRLIDSKLMLAYSNLILAKKKWQKYQHFHMRKLLRRCRLLNFVSVSTKFMACRHCNWYGYMMTSSNGNIFRVTGPLCGEFTGLGEFPTQRPVTRSFDVFFDLSLNKRLSKQPWGWCFETPSCPLWRYFNNVSIWQLVMTNGTINCQYDISIMMGLSN